MQFTKFGVKPNVRKLVTCLAALAVLFGFLEMVNPDPASALTVTDTAGLPDRVFLSWTENPSTTQTISWRTAGTAPELVQYQLSEVFSGSFDGAQTVNATATFLYADQYHEEATLRGLNPNTSYIYRVGREGYWGEPASFATAGPAGQFSFLYMGDVQRGYEYWGEMLKSAVAENPGLKFGLLGGDLVDAGNDSYDWEQFFDAAAPVFSRIPLMPATGNHDDKDLFWNSFALPQNGPAGFKEKFYSFDYGNCHIAVLDSNYMGASGAGYDKISDWLRNDLNNSGQRWKFLVFHHPPYPVVPDDHAGNLQINWVPLFEQCDVDVVFVGHQHVYMRTKPIRAGQVTTDGNGIVYIMGNAGMKYYPAGPAYDYIAKELDYVSNYEVININGDTFTLTARDAGGQVIDSYTITKQPVTGKAVYSITPLADAAYLAGAAPDGIKTMTVNSGVSGMKYFGVQVTPVTAHSGPEAVVFVHLRNGVQDSLNITKADFDVVHTAQAGFNVQYGDVVKAYVVDDLTNAVNFNPTILQ
jgi:hypothetical protein